MEAEVLHIYFDGQWKLRRAMLAVVWIKRMAAASIDGREKDGVSGGRGD